MAVATIMLLAGCGIEQVDTGYRGVQTRFGEVNEKLGSLPEGLYFYNPFSENIIEMDTRAQKWNATTNTYTKDVQQADITFTVVYRLDPTKAHTVFRTIGAGWQDKVVGQAVMGPLKQIIGTYDAVDLIEHRSKATQEVTAAARAALASSFVILDTLELINIQYHKQFEKAVEDKVVAVQRAVEEKNKTVQVQEQAKQAVLTAQATAESMRIRANALASNPKLVEYEAVQKWDGKLPQYNFGGGGTVPFINLNPSK